MKKWWAGVQIMQFQPSGRIGKMWLIQENAITLHIAESVMLLRADFSYV